MAIEIPASPGSPSLAKEALLPLAKRFVWRLRDDVRKGKGAAESADPFFDRWWLLKGRSEYPAWSWLSPEEVSWLQEPTVKIAIEETTLTLPRAFELLMGFRPDVLRRFTTHGRLDLIGAAGWFLTLGLKQHLFQPIITSDLIRVLDRPAPGQDQDQSVPSATLLMRLVWQLLDASLHEPFSLKAPNSRERFIAWFFGFAVKKFDLSLLIASRWRHWLLLEVPVSPQNATPVPRFALYASMFSPELQQRVKEARPDQPHPLKEWAQRTLRQGGQWHWLKAPKDPAAEHLSIPPKATQGAVQKPFGVNLFGFAFGELGIGEDLRMAVDACESAGIPHRVVNIDAGRNLRQADHHLKDQVARSLDASPYAINVFCLPGFDMVSRIFLGMGPEVFEGHYNIGWWPWELSVWPKDWQEAFSLIDELWAGSDFARAMYAHATPKPVTLMPLPVCVARHQPLPRQHFGLPKKDFLFLFIFDFNSHLARKNPEAAIAAFREAFPPGTQHVGLVLKVMNGRDGDARWDAFQKKVQADPRIVLITETLDRHAVLALVETCNAYLSLHRAEGFGRTLAEAMLMGKPVIATDYSGNRDFMRPDLTFPVRYAEVAVAPGDYPFVSPEDHALWADPSVDDAARQMRAAMHRAGQRQFAHAVKAFAEKQFSISRIGTLMKTRLEAIRGQHLGGLAVSHGRTGRQASEVLSRAEKLETPHG